MRLALSKLSSARQGEWSLTLPNQTNGQLQALASTVVTWDYRSMGEPGAAPLLRPLKKLRNRMDLNAGDVFVAMVQTGVEPDTAIFGRIMDPDFAHEGDWQACLSHIYKPIEGGTEVAETLLAYYSQAPAAQRKSQPPNGAKAFERMTPDNIACVVMTDWTIFTQGMVRVVGSEPLDGTWLKQYVFWDRPKYVDLNRTPYVGEPPVPAKGNYSIFHRDFFARQVGLVATGQSISADNTGLIRQTGSIN